MVDMHIFDVILRVVIQSAVMIVWGLFALAFITCLIGRSIRFLWIKFHPVRAIVYMSNDDVVDAEWVREM
jgi:hypothetical protein